MKVRIGISLPSGSGGEPGGFADAVDSLEMRGIDSLWLSELVYGPLVEPFIGATHALARTVRLKVGTGVAVLPGRNPVLVAKELATIAGLAPGRMLPVFGLQSARDEERALFPVPAGRRGAVFDESLRLLRLLLTQETVSFEGEFFTVKDVSVGPVPGKPLDIWLGGKAPAGLRRIGRLGDGWLGSVITPDEAREAREAIQEAAASAGREVDPEHFGVSIGVATDGLSSGFVAALRARRPDAEPAELAAGTWADARRLIERYVAAGLSKFVVRPAATPVSLDHFLDGFARELIPLQT